MIALPGRTLKAKTPCCQRAVRLRAIEGVPREIYERTCTGCLNTWTIRRTTLVERPQVKADKLVWSIEP